MRRGAAAYLVDIIEAYDAIDAVLRSGRVKLDSALGDTAPVENCKEEHQRCQEDRGATTRQHSRPSADNPRYTRTWAGHLIVTSLDLSSTYVNPRPGPRNGQSQILSVHRRQPELPGPA